MSLHQTFPDIAAENTRAVMRPSWDRGDGYDANDPHAPDVFRCGSCDAIRAFEVGYCPTCEGTTASYVDRQQTDSLIYLGSRWAEVL